MRIKKKKSIKEMKMELEQFITNTGQSEGDIHNNVNDYCALKRKIGNPNSRHDDDDIWRMKDLQNVYLLGKTICNRQQKIHAARKVAAAAAAAAATATIATSSVANTSISSYATSVDSSASTLINGNKITASFETTPPSSSDPSTTSSLPSSNDETRASLDIISLYDQSSILTSHSISKITASFEANASFALSTSRLDASDTSMVGT
jgi:hypothetical protein